MAEIAIYWFRNDLRLLDNPAFLKACSESDLLLPIYWHSRNDLENNQFERIGIHRQIFLKQSLEQLKNDLNLLNSDLIEVSGSNFDCIINIAGDIKATKIFFERIQAPEEIDEELKIKQSGLEVVSIWQSSMLDINELPFNLENMPDVFTQFRKVVESSNIKPNNPQSRPTKIPPLPKHSQLSNNDLEVNVLPKYHQSSFPYLSQDFKGGETHALSHLDNYLEKKLAHTYKETRNQLFGVNFSTKFSPWLSLGSISARFISFKIKEFENQYGANDSTYWIWFELLWRDYFRFLHFKFGKKLYRKNGLNEDGRYKEYSDINFKKWVLGETGNKLINAGMKELKETGYLSNRMRQIVASYLIYDLGCDWRKGASWFESQLIDYDVYSNHGNWLYIAGLGTDPRGGRRFNIQKQNEEYDSSNAYKNLWLN